MWADEPPLSRSLDDVAWHASTKPPLYTRLKDVAGAYDAVQPILQMPQDRKISWIIKRLDELPDHLDAADSNEVSELAVTIRDTCG